MNILYTFLNFNGLTGSELYYYELAKEMVKLGHKVTIASNCDGIIKQKAKEVGIKCCSFSDVSFLGHFDIIHASHQPVVEGLLNCAITCPVVVTCHSEVLKIERIRDHKAISHFIGIRPSIIDLLPEGKRSLIFNPIDNTRFNTIGSKTRNHLGDYIFFPGTINYLRINPLIDLVRVYGENFKIVCMGSTDYPETIIDGVEYLNSSWNIEDIIKGSRFVAGIIKGRTYMEAAMCGKHYLNYQVNEKGIVTDIRDYLSKNTMNFDIDVPKEDFYSVNVAKRIELLYRELL